MFNHASNSASPFNSATQTLLLVRDTRSTSERLPVDSSRCATAHNVPVLRSMKYGVGALKSDQAGTCDTSGWVGNSIGHTYCPENWCRPIPVTTIQKPLTCIGLDVLPYPKITHSVTGTAIAR